MRFGGERGREGRLRLSRNGESGKVVTNNPVIEKIQRTAESA